jgi:predicted MFS family arabinose efflux permease
MGAVPDVLTAVLGIAYPYSIRIMYLATGLVAITSLLPLTLVREEKRPVTRRKWVDITSWRVVSWVALTNGLIGLGAGFIVPWFSYYFTRKFGVNLGDIGVVFAVSQVGMAAAYLIVPKMAEKVGSVRTIVYSQATSILVLVLISISPTFAVASVLYLVRVILMNMTSPAFSSFFMGLLKAEERASGNSVVWASWNIGNALPRPVAGYIIDNVCLDANLYICAALYSVSTIIFFTIFAKAERRPSKEH